MKSLIIFLPLLLGFVLSAYGNDACTGKPDSEVRLDQSGQSLENAEVLDQDSIGVCYAAATTTALQSVLPGHPDLSYLDYALQYKKEDYRGRTAHLFKRNNSNILEFGHTCANFEAIKKDGLCPREKIELEVLSSQTPELQIESIDGYGKYFDLQKNLTPEKRKKANEVIVKALERIKEGGIKECENFPSEMRELIKKIYLELEKDLEHLKWEQSNAHRPESEALEAIRVSTLEKKEQEIKVQKLVNDRNELQQKHKERVQLLSSKGKSDQAEQERFTKASEALDLKVSEAQKKLSSLSLILAEREKKHNRFLELKENILKTEESLKLIGKKSPNPESTLSNSLTITLNDEIERKLKSDYREMLMAQLSVSKNQRSGNRELAQKMISDLGIFQGSSVIYTIKNSFELGRDFDQLTPSGCRQQYEEKNRSAIQTTLKDDLFCVDPNLINPAFKLIQSVNQEMNAKLNASDLANRLSGDPFQFLSDLIGSNCTSKDRIKIPPTLKCNKREIQSLVLSSPGSPSMSSDKAYSVVAKKFKVDSLSSVNKGRAVFLGVCMDLFDSVTANTQFGQRCKNGGHAVTMIGYRCKSGKMNYLIQNSWGSSNGPYGTGVEQSNGRVWIPESLLINNLMEYATFDGGNK